MSKILMIIAPQNYQDNEFEIPRDTFINSGHTVTVASKDVKIATGVLGGTTKVDIDISQVNPDMYDSVVFVGGSGADLYFDDLVAHKIVKEFSEADKVVAAICIAPSTLANAGILNGKKATAFSTQEKHLKNTGATYTGSDVEVDGRIVTANGPGAAKEFADKILAFL